MRSDYCTCPIGQDGSPCKHQFSVLKKFNLGSQNFLPMFDVSERQHYSITARGSSLPLKFYYGLQEIRQDTEQQDQLTSALDCSQPNEISSQPDTNCTDQDTASRLKQFIVINSQPELLKGILKFSDRIQSSSATRVAAGLNCFGNKYIWSKIKNSSLQRNKQRKSLKNHLHVQPATVKRRKNKIRSKKTPMKESTSVKSLDLPSKSNVSRKRPQDFSENIADNVQVSKKSGRNVFTRTNQQLKSRVR